MKNFKYLFVGILFGILFVKSEILSWFRIHEMFRLQSFFMFGIIITAIAVAMLSVSIIKKFNIKTFSGEDIVFEVKESNKGQIFGGLIFGIGWAITGFCPGPMYAQMGAGFAVVVVIYLSAIFGTWCYGYFKSKLPH